MQIRTYRNAKIVFDYFSGECFNPDGQLVVIVSVDDEGCVCEDVDGDEEFYQFHQLGLEDSIYQELLEIKETLK